MSRKQVLAGVAGMAGEVQRLAPSFTLLMWTCGNVPSANVLGSGMRFDGGCRNECNSCGRQNDAGDAGEVGGAPQELALSARAPSLGQQLLPSAAPT